MQTLTPDAVLTLTQSLQLAGLMPCVFVVVFLFSLIARNQQAVVPMLYFMALACGFILPLLKLFPALENNMAAMGALHFGNSTLVAMSFLLIMQFVLDRVPPPGYWLVLALPVIGGGALIYAGVVEAGESCLRNQGCGDLWSIRTLYNIFGSSLVFLLLIYYASRAGNLKNDKFRKHKYGLIVSLVALHLLVLVIDLAQLAGKLTPDKALFAATMLRLTFIYVVLTSLFRVFYPAMVADAIQPMLPYARAYDPRDDLPHVEKIKSLLEDERVYREMRLNRARLAELAGIGEYHLSRVINHHFEKSFNELVNTYRIEEAKLRLKNEPLQQVTVIGFEVGFNSMASFNRVFKAKVGQSPTEFRERH